MKNQFTVKNCSLEKISCLVAFSRGMNTEGVACSLDISTSHVNKLIGEMCREFGVGDKTNLIAIAKGSPMFKEDYDSYRKFL